jgi:hypothetical protein
MNIHPAHSKRMLSPSSNHGIDMREEEEESQEKGFLVTSVTKMAL